MPYTKATAPDWVKKLPAEAKDAWIKAFNAAYAEYNDDGKAAATASATIKKMGYKKSGDKWIKESAAMKEKVDIFAEMKRLQESAPIGSFEKIRDKVKAALDKAKFFVEAAAEEQFYYVEYTFFDKVLFSYKDKKYVVNYGMNESGEVVFTSEPKEVEEVYVMKESELREANIEITESVKDVEDFELSNFISLKEAKYNEKEGYFDNVILIEAGTNPEKKRHYPIKTIKEAAPHFAHLKQYLNHETEEEAKQRPERNIRDWASTIVESRYENGKVVAKVAVHDAWLRERLADPVARQHIGLSINTGGKISVGKVDGELVEIVEAIVFKRKNGPASVDWVTEAGARGHVMPLQESIKLEDRKMDLKELKEKHPELVSAILKESQEGDVLIKTQTELKETQTQLAAFKRKELMDKQVNLVESMLNDKTIPVAAKARIKESFSKELIEKESELKESVEKALKAELDYINSLSEKGVIQNGNEGDSKTLRESLTKQLSKDLGLPVEEKK